MLFKETAISSFGEEILVEGIWVEGIDWIVFIRGPQETLPVAEQ